MEEEESIAEYFLRVDEIVNAVRGPKENVLEEMIVQKVLRSLSLRYDSKISSLEDITGLDKLTMGELHGILTAYDMRIGQEGPSRKEVAFKASKESKKYEVLPKNHSENSDDEEALFIKKLKKGTGKYK